MNFGESHPPTYGSIDVKNLKSLFGSEQFKEDILKKLHEANAINGDAGWAVYRNGRTEVLLCVGTNEVLITDEGKFMARVIAKEYIPTDDPLIETEYFMVEDIAFNETGNVAYTCGSFIASEGQEAANKQSGYFEARDGDLILLRNPLRDVSTFFPTMENASPFGLAGEHSDEESEYALTKTLDILAIAENGQLVGALQY